MNLAKLHLSESVHIVHSDSQLVNKRSHNTPSKEALLELCAALIRAPGGNNQFHVEHVEVKKRMSKVDLSRTIVCVSAIFGPVAVVPSSKLCHKKR